MSPTRRIRRSSRHTACRRGRKLSRRCSISGPIKTRMRKTSRKLLLTKKADVKFKQQGGNALGRVQFDVYVAKTASQNKGMCNEGVEENRTHKIGSCLFPGNNNLFNFLSETPGFQLHTTGLLYGQMSGYLQKQSAVLGLWNQRYCVLEYIGREAYLAYYDNENMHLKNIPRGTFRLTGSSVSKVNETEFKLQEKDGTETLWKSSDDIPQWVEKLNAAASTAEDTFCDKFLTYLDSNCKAIGKGAEATVYKLTDTVAIRVQNDSDTFTNEYTLAKLISSHPNIVTTYSCRKSKSKIFTSLELCEQSLDEKIKKDGHAIDTWPLKARLRILVGVASGLAHMHAQGYCHRDIKPANILLAGVEEVPKICDFGMSKKMDKVDDKGTGENMSGRRRSYTLDVGTPVYQAPEVMNSNNPTTIYDTKIDIYSFGILMWSVFSGRKPYALDKQPGTSTLTNKIANGKRPSDTEFCPDLQLNEDSPVVNCIRNCWNQDASTRKSALELYEDLKTLLNTELVDPIVGVRGTPGEKDFVEGEKCLFGTGNQKDNIFNCFQRASNLSFAPGMVALAMCYQFSIGVDQDIQKANTLAKNAIFKNGLGTMANDGNSRAQFWFSICYRLGLGIEENYEEEQKLFNSAKQQGYKYANDDTLKKIDNFSIQGRLQ